ncbi:hypothetical protein P7L87_25800, partial [Vibrio parahaemolyticus]|nr:hypothetical protein [Vibrio parahaemolyticus]
ILKRFAFREIVFRKRPTGHPFPQIPNPNPEPPLAGLGQQIPIQYKLRSDLKLRARWQFPELANLTLSRSPCSHFENPNFDLRTGFTKHKNSEMASCHAVNYPESRWEFKNSLSGKTAIKGRAF